MKIENSSAKDIDGIFRLYEISRNYQKVKGTIIWPEFDRELIETEVAEDRQWKIIIDGKIACVWATTFDDPQIWEERNADPSVYIHRIATDPDFRGMNLVVEIANWAKEYAKQNEKQYIRLDTVSENKGLIKHYQKCGFDFLGLFELKDTAGLPAHYHNATVSLFEMKVPTQTNTGQ